MSIAQDGEMAEGPSSPRTPVRRRFARRVLKAGQTVIERDAALITMMAAVIALSAFSVWQATRASDLADDMIDQSRVLQAETVRQASYFQTLVNHDLNVLGSYCSSLIERDVGRVDLLGPAPKVSSVVAGDLKLRALHPLLQGDSPVEPCSASRAGADGAAGYSVARAQQSRSANVIELGDRGASDVTAAADRLSEQERYLMTAGLLFAVGLFGLIAIDALGNRSQRPARLEARNIRRWQGWSLGLSLVAFLGGLLLLTMKTVDHWYLLGFAVVLASAVVLRTRNVAKEARAVVATAPATRGHQAHWWAEVVGAVTLVAFSAAALGLSYVASLERDARSLSERQHAVAQELVQTGEQAALRDLATVAQLAMLDAEVAASNQEVADRRDRTSQEAAAIMARRDELAEQVEAIARSVGGQLADQFSTTRRSDCPIEPTATTRSPSDLLEEGMSDSAAFADYVYAHQEAARACDVLSAANRDNARFWASHASTFTVALVILGLAGFLLALAADPDRSRNSARWLLWVGGGGAVLGVAIGLLGPMNAAWSGARPMRSDELLAFSKDVAAGYHGTCPANVASLDRAINRSDTYGPAFTARAVARLCSDAVVTDGSAMSSDVDPAALPLIISDLTRAMELGPVTPTLTGNLGWAHIVRGLHDGNSGNSELQVGIQLSRTTVQALEQTWTAPATTIHLLRFNVALAHAALADEDAAVQEYEYAVRCLDPDQQCPGGGLHDRELRAEYLLWALADLELLADSESTDRFRQVLVGTFNDGLPAGGAWSGAQLDVFSQEVQVSGPGTPPDSAVIWYYRPHRDQSWGLLRAPSLATLRPGPNLNRPIAAEQLLLTGEYRADLYAGSTKTASLSKSSLPADNLARRESSRLGVSLVVPSDWEEEVQFDGVDWSLSPPSSSSGVALRRVEGRAPLRTTTGFLRKQLDTWVAERHGEVATDTAGPVPAHQKYFLGLSDFVVRQYDNPDLIAAAALAPYASDPYCGGALIMAVVGGSEMSQEVIDSVFQSIVLEEPPAVLPPIRGTFESDHFAIRIPTGWDAAGRPPGGTGNNLHARECVTGTNVLVNDEPLGDDTFDSFVDASLADFNTGEFPAFVLEEQVSRDVPGSEQAVELRFSWLAPSGPVSQRQVYATDGRTLAYLTFTTRAEDVDTFAEAADLLVDSFELRPG